MPRLVVCNFCKILQRMPDPHPKTPMVPAILEWTTGERYVYKDDKGLPVMVPAYDPMMEDFIIKHEHGREEATVIGGMIQVYQVDQKTWDSMDIVTKVRNELHDQHNEWYADRDEYRTAATKCYNDHGNPDVGTGCIDYLDDSKRFGPATYKAEGQVITVPPQFRQYLCYLCPYQQSYINVELRRRKGYYRD